MKEIKLTREKFTQVDDEDYEWLIQWKWNCSGKDYAVSRVYKKKAQMHRIIMKITDSKLCIDHIDGNSLNNQKSNLRIATYSQNSANKKSRIDSISKYLGVCKSKTGWMAYCKKNGTATTYYCKTEIEAAYRYNEIAIKNHGEYARLNIIPEGYTPTARKDNRRPVLQYTKEGVLVKEWCSVYEVRTVGMNPPNVQVVADKEGRTAHGYIWKFKNKNS